MLEDIDSQDSSKTQKRSINKQQIKLITRLMEGFFKEADRLKDIILQEDPGMLKSNTNKQRIEVSVSNSMSELEFMRSFGKRDRRYWNYMSISIVSEHNVKKINIKIGKLQ